MGRGRVGRNENVTGFEAILRILVAKLVIGFFLNMSHCLEIWVIL